MRAVSFLLSILLAVPVDSGGVLATTGSATPNIHSPGPEVEADAGYLVPKITFSGEVNEESVNVAILFIQKAESLGAAALLIELNTPGGTVDDGFRFAKAIEDANIPITCVVDGEAASMGFYLLQSCDTRIMTRRSLLMAHEPSLSGSVQGNRFKFQGYVELLKALAHAMNEHMAHRLKISLKDFERRIENRSWWMTWEEAQRIGAVDFVVPNVAFVWDSLHEELEPVPGGGDL